MIVIAHNIRSLHNTGALFRSADAFAVEKLYLTGYTATPPRKEIHKTALGSEHIVPWEYQADIFGLMKYLRENGRFLYGLETGDQTISIEDKQLCFPLALILGNEVTGIEKEVQEQLDALVEIPMRGRKKSINVSVAAGIALFVLSSRS